MASPNENVTGTLKIGDDGVISYRVKLGTEVVIPFSRLGLELASGSYPGNSLYDGWSMSGLFPFFQMPREEWTPVWGEQSVVKDHYNQLMIRATQSRPVRRQVVINLRAYDIGVAVNMEFPEQETLYNEALRADRTEFKMLGDHQAWWAPADYDAQDRNFVRSRLSEIPALAEEAINNDITLQQGSPVGGAAVQTPITLKTDDGIFINIHEAGGDTFPSMNLKYNPETMTFDAHLTPDDSTTDAPCGIISGPLTTPWRAVMVTRDPAAMLTSHMIYNLNNEPAVTDTTWIKPVKSVGVWWELVNGDRTWRYTDELSAVEIGVTDYSQVTPNGRHGATTERVKTYIDFAAKNSFDAVCFEGWNEGWEHWVDTDKEVLFDFIKSYPDVDETAIANAAADRNVSLIKHHEVGSAISDYQLKAPAALAHTAGLKPYSAVKVGYHGGAFSNGAHHTSQSTNAHYLSLIEEAQKNKLSISLHGGLKPTGLSRTYPHLLSATVGRTNAHALLGTSASHATILPWNHLIGAPIEYGAGIVNTSNSLAQDSLMKQIALLLVLYAPNQYIADTVENLMEHSDLLKIVADMPNTWHQSIYLEAEIGEYVTVARKVSRTGAWFIGSISAFERRDVELSLDFLDGSASYEVVLLNDEGVLSGDAASSYSRVDTLLTKDDTITFSIPANGGFVARLIKQSNREDVCAEAD